MGDFLQTVFVLALLGGAGYVAWRLYQESSNALKNEKIQERWETLIEDGQGHAEEVLRRATEYFESAQPPEVTWERREIRAGGLLSGKRYDFLTVRNRNLKDFRAYLTAYDYGTSLHVAWFLTIEQSLCKRIMGIILFWQTGFIDPKQLSYALDIPKQLELNAYTTTVHRSTVGSVRALMEQLKQDFSKVDTQSKGFLELW